MNAEQIVSTLLEEDELPPRLLEDVERVVLAAIRIGGKVVSAVTHAHAIEKAAEEGALAPLKIYSIHDYENLEADLWSLSMLYRMPIESGFVTNLDRFISRQEAYELMKPPQENRFWGPGTFHSDELKESLLLESPQIAMLKASKRPLTSEERDQIMSAKAVWHTGNDGAASPAIWKAVVRGKTWFVSNTHRCYAADSTLTAAIQSFFKTVEPSA